MWVIYVNNVYIAPPDGWDEELHAEYWFAQKTRKITAVNIHEMNYRIFAI